MSRVVVLNGGSSAGKSTLAATFRDQRAAVGDFCFLIAIDDYLVKLPAAWFELGEHVGEFSRDGMTVAFGPDGAVISFGPTARGVLIAYQGAVAAAAHAGPQVIVDELVFDRATWDSWGVALTGQRCLGRRPLRSRRRRGSRGRSRRSNPHRNHGLRSRVLRKHSDGQLHFASVEIAVGRH